MVVNEPRWKNFGPQGFPVQQRWQVMFFRQSTESEPTRASP